MAAPVVVELNDPHGVGVVHLRQVVIVQVLHPPVLVQGDMARAGWGHRSQKRAHLDYVTLRCN